MEILNYIFNDIYSTITNNMFYLIGTISAITWFIGTIIYTIKNWKNEDVDSIDIFLLFTGGVIFAFAFGFIILILLIVLGIPIWIIDKLREY